jgi:hypothetical protein
MSPASITAPLTLSGLVLLLRCSALLAGCYVLYLGWKQAVINAQKTNSPNTTKYWLSTRLISPFLNTTPRTSGRADPADGLIRRWPVVLVILLFGAFIYIAWAASRPPNYVKMYNVWVVSRLDDLTFRVKVMSPGTGQWSEFVIRSCPDWTPTNEIQRGVTLTLLQYVEDHAGECDELDGHYAGYILLRDDNAKPVYSADPSQSGSSTP